ncbi:polysaccharide deacetylase family protein [Daejeonella sp. H1SJ63]|uniref:polysaccharide deacetylase family protein n=1 Tax=Daejeonella sp. H1SJ63 TaxID=3034145 RepID=UPI0023ED6842|nr:polysaccharide deacetylase family protein [Daejeonella sp. H1SJ63]
MKTFSENLSGSIRLFEKYYFLLLLIVLFSGKTIHAQEAASGFAWPEGKQIAISLSFDDARASQVDAGTALLDEYGVKATFYVVPNSVKQRLEGWKKAAENGHEIGNHSYNHPCTGNFPWSRQKAIENYTLKKMKKELIMANHEIENLLGIKSEVFAYPCGQTYVGSGKNTRSYVPVVSKLFLSGRGWLDEGPNDPQFCDPAQLTGMEMDGKEFEQILPLIENAKKTGAWLVLAGHEMGSSGSQTTRLSMLKKLIEYAQNPANGIWIAPVGTVVKYIKAQKG